MKYHSIAFDLDDTLLDTSGLLVPNASRQACAELIRGGVPCSLAACMRRRAELAPHHSHREIFALIAAEFTSSPPKEAIDAATRTFYHPQLPQKLDWMPGARELLAQIKNKYALYIVTSGAPETQKEKIARMDIAGEFRDCLIVDGFAGKTKTEAFQEILKRENIPAQKLLAVGNRLSQEIRLAKRLGAQTCYMKYGEHVGEIPRLPEDHPDYTITHLNQLIPVCGL